MTTGSGRTFGRLAVAALAVAGVTATANVASVPRAEAAVKFTDLRGNWRGWGWVTLNNGGRERVRCRVSYSPRGNNNLSQNLRCASTTYKIDAVTTVRRRGNKLSGQWKENSFNVKGTLSGRATNSGFSLSLAGDVFSAGMSVSVSKCNQSLNINVRGIEIRTVSMTLKRC